ncbi:Uncharacterised protein [Yersinia intermedia]|uniref:Ankyrin repeat domain-containing protein n=1 Tax=Yersinia intermedia TaxID=631 RepID=A0ABX6FHH1_YERIN|nr:hypothetical protein [Yersinia intermedia]EEQ20109.1 hypothetical protein yinte0001_8580 [Yersinia intermedia ATCC 29909]QGR67136.1 hypothetical protein FOC38_15030 [Yersinia intermedia]QGR72152.1 hypothetical protein FOC37_18330 [Yersinia intermedia]CRY80763.1 Uncharacterised protein [Yersinia intermedia]VDZ52503.1 Uncharacterised protein [Yersinia intermedia]
MGKYDKAFEEVEELMSEMLEQLNISLDETNLYSTDDMFRIMIKVMDVENIKMLSYIYSNDEFLEVEKDMSPAVNKFMWWWGDCLESGSFSIPALIASKEKEVISSLLSDGIEINDEVNKKRI